MKIAALSGLVACWKLAKRNCFEGAGPIWTFPTSGAVAGGAYENIFRMRPRPRTHPIRMWSEHFNAAERCRGSVLHETRSNHGNRIEKVRSILPLDTNSLNVNCRRLLTLNRDKCLFWAWAVRSPLRRWTSTSLRPLLGGLGLQP